MKDMLTTAWRTFLGVICLFLFLISYAVAGENVSFTEKHGISSEGLVLRLDMRDSRSYGTTQDWYDLSGNGFTASQTTVASQPSIAGGNWYGKTRIFDGNDDKFTIPYDAKFRSLSVTILLWLRVDIAAFNNSLETPISTASGNPPGNGGWEIYFEDRGGANGTEAIRAYIKDRIAVVDNSLADREFQLYTVVWDGALAVPDNLKIYVGGVEQSKDVDSGNNTGAFVGLKSLTIGWYGTPGLNYTGPGAVIMIFSRALTAAEILKYYNKTQKDFNK